MHGDGDVIAKLDLETAGDGPAILDRESPATRPISTPIRRICFVCACTAMGHAVAPPSSEMNSRRFMSSMGDFLPYALSARRPTRALGFQYLSLPQRGRLFLGADLNCSESR